MHPSDLIHFHCSSEMSISRRGMSCCSTLGEAEEEILNFEFRVENTISWRVAKKFNLGFWKEEHTV